MAVISLKRSLKNTHARMSVKGWLACARIMKLLLDIWSKDIYVQIRFPDTKNKDTGISLIKSSRLIRPAKGRKTSAVKINRTKFKDMGSTIPTPSFITGA
jgi:hypothetical protein